MNWGKEKYPKPCENITRHSHTMPRNVSNAAHAKSVARSELKS